MTATAEGRELLRGVLLAVAVVLDRAIAGALGDEVLAVALGSPAALYSRRSPAR